MDNDFPRNMLVATFKVETDILLKTSIYSF